MKIFKNNNVYDEALGRIRWLYDEFDNVIVSHSGGKDSVVVFNLTLQVAKERNRLPLKVLFLDQEVEWGATIDIIKEVMEMPEVEPYWFQMPMKIFNATSATTDWIHCWEEGKKWMREKHDCSIKENTYGTQRFKKLFTAVIKKDMPCSTANIGGVRAEESPSRLAGLTNSVTYKGETWGKKEDEKNKKYTFYPIYDWSYSDVWKAIHENKWSYCRIYDKQYSYGTPVRMMRVSSLCHETSVANLEYIHEAEQDTYNKLVERLDGISTEAKFGSDFTPKTLPWMFRSWKEYRDHLLENLIPEGQGKEKIKGRFLHWDKSYEDMESYQRICVRTVINNDYHFTHLDIFRTRCKRKFGEKRGEE